MELKIPEKEYNSTKHIKYSCQYHVIFCPKYRRPVLNDKISSRLKELITEKQDEYNYRIIKTEIMPDHVHLLISANPKISIFTTVNKIKGYTSKILREEFEELRTRLPTLWTHSKFISTVGEQDLNHIQEYILNQEGV